MIVKKLRILFGVLGIVLLTAAQAHAASWTTTFKIDFMDSDSANGGWSIIPVSGTVANNSQNDPADCVSGTTPINRFNIYASNLTQTQKDFVGRAILAAYMAGKSIKLEVSSATCVGGRPAYGNVALYP